MDLCAAPGSWSQVLSKRLGRNPKLDGEAEIVAVDIQTMAPLDGVTMIQGDITSPETATKIMAQFQGCRRAQLVVCDGAPDVTGQHDLDEFIQSQLLLAALNITTFILESGGTFVAKIFRGKDITLLIAQLGIFFHQVQVVKPKSSRTSSIEAFVVCRNFKLPQNYEPIMFDVTSNVDNHPKLREIAAKGDEPCVLIPFLMCGDLEDLTLTEDKPTCQ